MSETMNDKSPDPTDFLLEILDSGKSAEQLTAKTYRGQVEDVLGPLSFDEGLYIVSYSLGVRAELFYGFSLNFENIANRKDLAEISVDAFSGKKDKRHEGKQKLRLKGGKYLISVNVNSITDWEIQLQKVA